MNLEEIRKMSTSELAKEISRRMDELYLMRKEMSRRDGDMATKGVFVDFEKYVTE